MTMVDLERAAIAADAEQRAAEATAVIRSLWPDRHLVEVVDELLDALSALRAAETALKELA